MNKSNVKFNKDIRMFVYKVHVMMMFIIIIQIFIDNLTGIVC